MRGASKLLAMLAVLADSRLAVACPDCPTSRVVRAIVCGEHVWTNLAMTVAPFAIFAAVAGALHRIGRPPPGAG